MNKRDDLEDRLRAVAESTGLGPAVIFEVFETLANEYEILADDAEAEAEEQAENGEDNTGTE